MISSTTKYVIKPNQRFKSGTVSSFISMMRNIISSKDMIYQLFRKEFLAVYKKSFIGSAWIVLTPISGIIAWVFLHQANIIDPGEVTIPYPAFVLVGTLVWGLFLGIATSFMNAVTSYRYLLLWAYFPHEIIFCLQLLLRLTDFVISIVVTLFILILFSIFPSWGLILFPFVLIPLICLAMAIGMAISVISVVSYDLRKIATAILGLLLFITPVIYTTEAIEKIWIKSILYYNPLTYLVCSARDMVLFGRMFSLTGYIISTIFAIVLLLISWRIFYLTEDKIIERII